jgi:hypothetical protein
MHACCEILLDHNLARFSAALPGLRASGGPPIILLPKFIAQRADVQGESAFSHRLRPPNFLLVLNNPTQQAFAHQRQTGSN